MTSPANSNTFDEYAAIKRLHGPEAALAYGIGLLAHLVAIGDDTAGFEPTVGGIRSAVAAMMAGDNLCDDHGQRRQALSEAIAFAHDSVAQAESAEERETWTMIAEALDGLPWYGKPVVVEGMPS